MSSDGGGSTTDALHERRAQHSFHEGAGLRGAVRGGGGGRGRGLPETTVRRPLQGKGPAI